MLVTTCASLQLQITATNEKACNARCGPGSSHQMLQSQHRSEHRSTLLTCSLTRICIPSKKSKDSPATRYKKSASDISQNRRDLRRVSASLRKAGGVENCQRLAPSASVAHNWLALWTSLTEKVGASWMRTRPKVVFFPHRLQKYPLF